MAGGSGREVKEDCRFRPEEMGRETAGGGPGGTDGVLRGAVNPVKSSLSFCMGRWLGALMALLVR